MKTVNTEEIMTQIRQEIGEKGLSSEMLSFEDIPYRRPAGAGDAGKAGSEEFRGRLLWLKAHSYIQPYKQLCGNAVSVFAKKVIRKMAKFYVEPVVFEQNDFNAGLVSVIDSLSESNSKLMERVDALEKENAELRTMLETKRRKRK